MGRGNRARFSFSRRSQICCRICSLFKPGGLITKTSSGCLGTVIPLTYLSALPHVCRVVRTSESVTRRFCGTPNPPRSTKCYKCGTLYAFDSPTVPGTYEPLRTAQTREQALSPWKPSSLPSFDEEAVKGAHDTDRGLLLLAIGLFLGPIPVIGLLGLVLAFVGALLILIPVFLLGGQLSQAVYQATTSSDPSPLYAVIDQAQALRLLGLVPAIFYALAYLNARSRISNGEVP